MTLELSTDFLPEEERLPFWKGLLSQNLTSSHLESVDAGCFSGSMRVARSGSVTASSAKTTGHFISHSQADLDNASQHVVILQAIVEGEAEYICGNRRVVAGPGEVMVLDSSHAGDVLVKNEISLSVLTLPRHLVIPHFTKKETLSAALSELQRGLPTKLLHDFVVGLSEPDNQLKYSTGSIIQTTGGLLSMALEHLQHGTWGEDRGIAGARRAAIRSFILDHFADSMLSPASVAEEFKISVRYLHKLFADSGRTFREELLAVRMHMIWGDLTDIRQSGRTVSDIAFSAGFNDLSSFNRSFKGTYGMTPKEVRQSTNKI